MWTDVDVACQTDRFRKSSKTLILAVSPDSSREKAEEDLPMKLLDQIRAVARVKHFSYRTEQCYTYWAERYIRHHGIRHPNTMGAAVVEAFLTHLA